MLSEQEEKLCLFSGRIRDLMSDMGIKLDGLSFSYTIKENSFTFIFSVNDKEFSDSYNLDQVIKTPNLCLDFIEYKVKKYFKDLK